MLALIRSGPSARLDHQCTRTPLCSTMMADRSLSRGRPLLQGVFFCDIQWKGLFSRPGRKVQSLQTNTGFECTEVAPTRPVIVRWSTLFRPQFAA